MRATTSKPTDSNPSSSAELLRDGDAIIPFPSVTGLTMLEFLGFEYGGPENRKAFMAASGTISIAHFCARMSAL